MNIMKLQFNNRTVIYPGNSGYIAFDIPKVYHVTTSGTNGTVTASPSEGINGTVVTLTNTPNSGYVFNSYTVTGAILNNNTFTINNSDVTVVGNFDAVPERVMWYNNTSSYSNNQTINFTSKPTTSDYKYFTIRFNGHPGALGTIQLRRGTAQFAYMRGHPYISYSGLVPVGNGSAYTSCTPIASMTSKGLDGWTFYQTSLWPKGTNKWVKIAFDRPNMTAHFYVESTYVCTAKMQYDPITITNMQISDDQSKGRDGVSNISIAAFTTLDAAKAYSGPF